MNPETSPKRISGFFNVRHCKHHKKDKTPPLTTHLSRKMKPKIATKRKKTPKNNEKLDEKSQKNRKNTEKTAHNSLKLKKKEKN